MEYNKVQHKLGFWQVDPMPTQVELEKYYNEIYFQNCTSKTYSSEYSQDEIEFFFNRAVISEALWNTFSKTGKGKIFDVGCGEGYFINYFFKQGWQIEACDFSQFGVEQKNPEILSFFKCGDIYQILEKKIQSSEKYDFINLANVLEHVIDPLDLIDRLKNIMHEGSLMRIMVPNDFSDFQNLLLKNEYLKEETWFVPPDHLNYFTYNSINKIFIDRGFSIFETLSDFPIELFLVNEHSNYWKDRSKGTQANQSRIIVDNFLVKQGIDNYISYMSAAAKIGFGRSIVSYISLKNE